MKGVVLHLCVNNKYGDPTNYCKGISVEIDGDLLVMELACDDLPFSDLCSGFIRLDDKLLKYYKHQTMVGNAFWNAYLIDARQLVDLLNILKADSFISIIDAEAWIFRKWDSFEPYTLEDFGYDDASVHQENLLREMPWLRHTESIADYWTRQP